ncbi:MAG: type IV pilus assembly protein PilM [Planctomycetota bacterium]|jgi:type IV pilus assembly protein PilM
MAAETGTVWAIDIGNNSLKALYLSTERGVVEVIGFDNIRHGKILTGSNVTDAERDELVALSLRKFVNKYDLSLDEIVISVPSQNSFARFVNLPPVEQKRVPEMVKFEAVQQIPFGINDVQWDWQQMTGPDSPEIKVGIFAIKNEVVNSALEHFNREDVEVSYVQMAPMALYNYLLYDRPDLVTSDSQATVVLNIGADNTDLVVCTKSTVWQRCILIGGNSFTKAISDTFRLNFEKAEKLKRTAPVSKYARQIFQAMRPVFTDLASEVQRSLGFYNSSNPNTKIVRIIALGGTTKLRGLLKYLQQTLQIPVERPDSFKRLAIGPDVSPAKFHENVCDFGIVYGLALQGLGIARIESNLLPHNIARSRAWAGKGRYFIAAACMLLAVSLLCFARTGWDSMNYDKNSQVRQKIAGVLKEVRDAKQNLEEEKNKGSNYEAMIEKEFEPFKYREAIPLLHQTIISALPNEKNNPEQAGLYKAFFNGDIERISEIPRKDRKQVFITNMSTYFSNDLSTAQFGGADLWRRSRGTPGAEDEGMYDEMSEYDYAMQMQMEMGGGLYQYSPMGVGPGAQAAEEKKTGFVVTIAGYSPYGNNITELGELMDPHGVEDLRNKWGFITRLAHLDDLVEDVNSPFEVYKKDDPEHFNLEMKEVSWDEEIPAGIGVSERRSTTTITTKPGQGDTAEWVLVDPMTKETINKVAVLDEDGKPVLDRNGRPVNKVNDHWFVLNVKFVWTEGPEPPEPPAQLSRMSSRPGSRRPVSPPSSGSTGGRQLPSVGDF